jgi:GT2 family glycosyltransferase
MVARLVEQVLACPQVGQVIVTYNIPEASLVPPDERIEVIVNPSAKGFGANHNAAFQRAREPFWCVLNPDIELTGNPFPALLEALRDDAVALVAPLIISPEGAVEDSIRYFPTLVSLAEKFFGRDRSRYEVAVGGPDISPDWVAGMFMLFRAPVFAALTGFDERYFLYYEDVDICWRVWLAGLRVVACPAVSSIHDARRASRVSWRYRRWHLASMVRFLLKSLGRRPRSGELDAQ